MKSIFASLSKIFVVALVVGIGIGINFAFANWSAPGDTPPGGNVQVPVNVGGILQQKAGNFVAGGLRSLTSLVVEGRAGIGTTNPDPNSRLHINGQLKIQNIGSNEVNTKILTVNDTGDVRWRNPGDWTGSGGSNGLPSGTNGQTLRHNGSTWIGSSNIFNNGTNVGIGTTNPGAKLDVNGTAQAYRLKFRNSNDIPQFNNTSRILVVGNDGDIGYRNPGDWTGGGGGGGSTPNLQQVTDVGKSTTNDIRIAPSSGSLAGVTFGTGAGNNFIIGRPAGQNYFNLWDVSGDRDILRALPGGNGNLLLQPVNGNVGIGATPTEKLTVSGNIALASGNHRRISTSGTGNNLILGVNAVPNALTIQSGNGNVSIGPYVVAGRVLHVARAGSAVTINTVSSNGGGGSTLDLMTTWDAGGTGTPGSKGWALVARGDNYSPGQGDPSRPNDLVFGFWNSDIWMPEPMRLTRNGELYVGNALVQTSDANLKTNIQNLSDSLAKILELRGVTFNWKNRVDEKENIGFIAQEVEKIFPELVYGEDGSKSVNYVSLVPVLVEAVKELDEKNKELEARLEKLEKRLGTGL